MESRRPIKNVEITLKQPIMNSEELSMAKVRCGKVGDILRINLGNGIFGYGRVLLDPLMAFYDIKTEENKIPTIDDIVRSPILFRVWVMRSAIKSDNWEILGNIPVDTSLSIQPDFFKQDPISKKFYIYRDAKDILVSREACIGLERAAVWEAAHVENRLRNYFMGVPDPMTERLKLPEKDDL
jgi:hypothetical protein